MQHLHRAEKIVLLFVLILFSIPSFAQYKSKRNYNFENKDLKAYYFGISLGLHSSNYKVFRSRQFNDQGNIMKVESVTGPGYNVNVISNLKIGRYVDFRLLPGFSFSERNITYTERSGIEEASDINTVESVFVEIPFHVRYKSEPYNDMRVYAFGGVKYGFDIASKARTRKTDNILKIAPTDFSVEAGFGFQFFFPYFILSPELKFSHGLNNVLIFNDQSQRSNILENILSRSLTLSFHFEG